MSPSDIISPFDCSGVASTRSSSSSTFLARETAKLQPSDLTDLHARMRGTRDAVIIPDLNVNASDDDDCIHAAAAAAAALIQPLLGRRHRPTPCPKERALFGRPTKAKTVARTKGVRDAFQCGSVPINAQVFPPSPLSVRDTRDQPVHI